MVADPDFLSISEGNQLLGSDRKICVPKLPDDEARIIESSSENRYRLQGLAREILGDRDKRLHECLRVQRPGSELVEIRRDPEKTTAHFRNLILCNRVWTCPVCSARISNQRREELTQALAAAKLLGLHPVLVTYTLRHDGSDALQHVLGGLCDALRAFKSGRAYQDIKAEYDIVGGIRALEMTYGENGWHPHVHELLFSKQKLDPGALAGMRKWLVDRWVTSLRTLGFDASYAHGIDVRNADSKIAEYVAKFGREPREMEWGIEHELANAASKKAHADGLTPFQLLECYDIGDKRAERLFVEYAEAMAKHHQLQWSPGLRKLLVMPEPVEDEQLTLIEDTPGSYTAVEIDRANWNQVLLYDLRGALLWLVAVGDWTTLRALLRKYKIHADVQTVPPEIIDKPLLQVSLAKPPDNPTAILLFDLPPIKVRYE